MVMELTRRRIIIGINYDTLYEQYIIYDKTIAEVAEFFNCSSDIAYRYMKEFGIPKKQLKRVVKSIVYQEKMWLGGVQG